MRKKRSGIGAVLPLGVPSIAAPPVAVKALIEPIKALIEPL
jgi:hypothetical protein